MDILSPVSEYTFSWDSVGEWRCHEMRLGGIGEPRPCQFREGTRKIFWSLIHFFRRLWREQVQSFPLLPSIQQVGFQVCRGYEINSPVSASHISRLCCH